MDQPPNPPSVPSWRERLDLLATAPSFSPRRVAGSLGAVAALVVGGWLLLRDPAPPPEDGLPLAVPATTSTTVPAELAVHVAGAVARPALYHLPRSARVADAIDAAGGPLPDADLDRVNLAAPLADGTQVFVPRRGEAAGGSGGPSADGSATTGPLDLNVATSAQLEELPGIGPATAKAIIDARTKKGRFRSVDDLLDVRGIGPAKLDAIRELVTV
jgi:competence protein ComEA